MSVIIQPFQFLKFSKFLSNQLRFQEGFNNDLCDVPVIPKGEFIPFGIISGSNVIGDINLLCHNENLFYNTEISQVFTKNNCGYMTGSDVAYVVEAGKYSSSTQAGADVKAQNDIASNGQAYANAHGICSGFHWREDFDSLGLWVVEGGNPADKYIGLEGTKLRVTCNNRTDTNYILYCPNVMPLGSEGKTYRVQIQIDELITNDTDGGDLGTRFVSYVTGHYSINPIFKAVQGYTDNTAIKNYSQRDFGINMSPWVAGTNLSFLIDWIQIDEI